MTRFDARHPSLTSNAQFEGIKAGSYERAVACLSRNYDNYLDSACGEFGLTGSQVSLLMYLLAGHHGVTQNEIARALGVDKGTVSRNVKILVEAGLITQSACERDSRACAIDLTQAGIDMSGPLTDLSRRWTSVVTAGMTPKQRERLVGHLREMADRAVEFTLASRALQG